MTDRVQPHFIADGMIVSNPGILGGAAVFAGTRVPVATLFDYLAQGLALDYFLESFPTVTRDQAAGVLRYGKEQIERELAAINFSRLRADAQPAYYDHN